MNFSKSRPTGGVSFQMAPMLDIIFILLIHFMAATIFAQWENRLEISIPTAESGVQQDRRRTGEIIVNLDADGKIFINSREVSEESLLDILGRVSSVYQGQAVILRADRATNCQALIRVMDICRQADIWNIAFATIKPEEGTAP
jgi:biopolymer transport protein ExbD